MDETVYLSISQWKTRPVHFYGTVRDENEKVLMEVLQCATRQRVIDIAERDLPGMYPDRKFKLIVRRGVRWF